MKRYLSIGENEKVLIPKKYHKINDLCAVIYDQLVEIYHGENYENLSKTDINFENNPALFKEFKKSKLNPLDWLQKHGLNKEIEIILTKEILRAVCSDFINFIFESMHCAKIGKMTVAYALLRKPFTDELLILEQLLLDRKEFIKRFYFSGNPKDYDPSDRNLDKKSIIDNAIEKLRIPIITSGEFIYNLRYNKEYEAGINGITNHALHIVTKDKRYMTQNQNLNFVFSNNEDMDRYYEHYYNLIPFLLIYSVAIIDELVFSLLEDEDNKNVKTVKEFRRFIGLMLFTEYVGINEKKDNKALIDTITKNLIFECPKCGNVNQIERADLELFFETETFICSKCISNLLTTKESVRKLEKAFLESI